MSVFCSNDEREINIKHGKVLTTTTQTQNKLSNGITFFLEKQQENVKIICQQTMQ